MQFKALPQERNDKKLVKSQCQKAAGPQAVRKYCSNILSKNGYNARQKLFDNLGFLSHQINKFGVSEALAQGFMVLMKYSLE